MRFNAPRKLTVLIALILVISAVLGYFVFIPFVTVHAFWISVAGFAVLLFGNTTKGF